MAALHVWRNDQLVCTCKPKDTHHMRPTWIQQTPDAELSAAHLGVARDLPRPVGLHLGSLAGAKAVNAAVDGGLLHSVGRGRGCHSGPSGLDARPALRGRLLNLHTLARG